MNPERAITEAELLENLAWIRALAQRLVGEHGDDLAQQVCLAALDGARIAQPPKATRASRRVRAWLARATANLAGHHHRAEWRRRRRERLHARFESQPATHDVVARNALLAEVVQALDELAEPYRTTVLLRYLDEQSIREIANRSGVSEPVVRKRLSRGLAKLRARLDTRRFDARLFGTWLLPSSALGTTTTTSKSSLGLLVMGTTLTKTVAGATLAGAAALVLFTNPFEEAALPGPANESTESHAAAPSPLPEAELPQSFESTATPSEPSDPVPERRTSLPRPETRPSPQQESKQAADRDRQRAKMEELAVMLDLLAVREAELAERQRPPDGYHVEKYEDGSRKAAGMILEGHRDGEWSLWHPDGNPEARGPYFAGLRHGAWTFWGPQGHPVRQGEYLYGRQEGPWIEHEQSLRLEAEYRAGKRHGPLTRTHPAGHLTARENWFRGQLHGAYASFYPDGSPESRGQYLHGQKHGPWTRWHPDGTPDPDQSRTYDPTTIAPEIQARRDAALQELRQLESQFDD